MSDIVVRPELQCPECHTDGAVVELKNGSWLVPQCRPAYACGNCHWIWGTKPKGEHMGNYLTEIDDNPLALDMKVLCYIYRSNVAKDPVWFRKILARFAAFPSHEVSKVLDKLEDLCVIDGEYIKVGSYHTRCFTINGDAELLAWTLNNKHYGPDWSKVHEQEEKDYVI